MRYMVFVKMAEDVGDAPPQLHEAMGAALQEAFADGSMIDAGGLYPTAQSTEVRLTGGRVVITDGPYSEAKEVAGGYWPGWEGSVEVRRIATPQEGPPPRS
jgi:hypothetical protein